MNQPLPLPLFPEPEMEVLPDSESGELLPVSPPVRGTLPAHHPTDEGQLRFSHTTASTTRTGAYPYTGDLLALAAEGSRATGINSSLAAINTPLKLEEWGTALQDHPDQRLARFLLEGIQHGFRVGCSPHQLLESARRNMPSALANPSPVSEYLKTELQAGRVLGPFEPGEIPEVHVSRFGVIPKKHQPGKWRLILDLSHPPNASVNDGVARELSTLRYASVDDAANLVSQLGQGTMMAKIDIAHAYRNVPVHPDDRSLLGMRWKDQLFIDTALPFGLRSAPKIFSAISDTLEWILRRQGMTCCLHYLDDFLTMGVANSPECERNLKLLIEGCARLGIPVAVHKVEGPTTVLIFLGIEFDTIHMTMRLPAEKLERLKALIRQWLGKKAAKKREILSLIGELAHAAKVVTAGRTFMRRMLDVAHSRPRLDHWIRLSQEFRADLSWWDTFIVEWNGVSLLRSHIHQPPAVSIFTDASGGWGCGATDGELWFQCAWEEHWQEVNIATKELVPIILAVGTWGRRWAHCHVRFRSDNMAVVEILKARTSKDATIMHLLRCLHFLCAAFSIRISATHIPGVDNTAADALSRNRLNQFFLSLPKASSQPTVVPQELWRLVMADRVDFLASDWRSRLGSFSRQA